MYVKSGVAVQAYIFGKLAECSAVSISNFAALVSQVEDVLTIDNLHICSGGTSMKDFVSPLIVLSLTARVNGGIKYAHCCYLEKYMLRMQ